MELEWLTVALDDPGHRFDVDELDATVPTTESLPEGGHVSWEPGGQLELKTPPHDGLAEATHAADADAAVVRRRLADRGVGLLSIGLDPVRAPRRVNRAARYRAMAASFDHAGPAGRTMMCNTAALQVNVELGDGGRADPTEDPTSRWRLAHCLGPTMIACFANSPFADGGPSGWMASRLATWWRLDPSRTAAPVAGPPADTWTEYALAANVLMVRADSDRYEPVTGLTFGQWMSEGHELGWPTEDDFAYHLTTLFPPIRPRGWLELRMLDALDARIWPVAVAALVVLLVDEQASDAARRATRGTTDLWAEAAQWGLAHPGLAASARSCLEATLPALERLRAPRDVVDAVADFADRYVARGRCPADDLLDTWRSDGRLLPEPSPDGWR